MTMTIETQTETTSMGRGLHEDDVDQIDALLVCLSIACESDEPPMETVVSALLGIQSLIHAKRNEQVIQ